MPNSKRTTRAEEYHEETYVPASNLGLPEGLVDQFLAEGCKLVWKRVMIQGDDDKLHVSNFLREGHTFVTYDELGDFKNFFDTRDIQLGRQSHEIVTRGDLALTKFPVAKAQARRKYYDNKSLMAERAALGEARQGSNPQIDSAAPLESNNKTKVTINEGGRNPAGFGATDKAE